MQEWVGVLGMPEEGDDAVAIECNYSSEHCGDEELKNFATVQPVSHHGDSMVNGSRGHSVI
jgi:hypothetical protein